MSYPSSNMEFPALPFGCVTTACRNIVGDGQGRVGGEDCRPQKNKNFSVSSQRLLLWDFYLLLAPPYSPGRNLSLIKSILYTLKH
eukprot:scaffold219174_cov39-Tisochrysis_lutea.AAC.1